MMTYSLTLPRSGLIALWREDDTCQIQRASEVDNQDWGPASASYSSDPQSFPYQLKQQLWPGDSPDPTWWLVISALHRPAAVSAMLADGSSVPVHRLGSLILCEWESTPQRLTVTIDRVTHNLDPFRSGSRGSAPFPYH
jgi:hypothetical protein